jgi:Tol biopolymer transport system component
MKIGVSGDQTLSWTSSVRADGSRRVIVRLWDGTAMQPVIDDRVAAPASRP